MNAWIIRICTIFISADRQAAYWPLEQRKGESLIQDTRCVLLLQVVSCVYVIQSSTTQPGMRLTIVRWRNKENRVHKCLQPLVYDLFWHKISGALCHNHPLELLYGLLPAILAFPNNKETHHALSHLPINSLTLCSTCSQPSCSFWQLFVWSLLCNWWHNKSNTCCYIHIYYRWLSVLYHSNPVDSSFLCSHTRLSAGHNEH